MKDNSFLKIILYILVFFSFFHFSYAALEDYNSCIDAGHPAELCAETFPDTAPKSVTPSSSSQGVDFICFGVPTGSRCNKNGVVGKCDINKKCVVEKNDNSLPNFSGSVNQGVYTTASKSNNTTGNPTIDNNPGTASSNNEKKSISGDSVCGGTFENRCNIEKAKVIFKNFFTDLVLPIMLSLIFLWVVFNFATAWFAAKDGKPEPYKEALKRAGNAIVGLVIVSLVFGGFYLAILKFVGTNPQFLKFIELLSDSFISTSYAQGIPSVVSSSTWYDFFLVIVSFAIRWFIYPMIIVIWVWTGFLYVAAQGAPEKLKDAHGLLLKAFISTVVVLTTEGFLYAIQATINKIIS